MSTQLDNKIKHMLKLVREARSSRKSNTKKYLDELEKEIIDLPSSALFNQAAAEYAAELAVKQIEEVGNKYRLLEDKRTIIIFSKHPDKQHFHYVYEPAQHIWYTLGSKNKYSCFDAKQLCEKYINAPFNHDKNKSQTNTPVAEAKTN